MTTVRCTTNRLGTVVLTRKEQRGCVLASAAGSDVRVSSDRRSEHGACEFVPRTCIFLGLADSWNRDAREHLHSLLVFQVNQVRLHKQVVQH